MTWYEKGLIIGGILTIALIIALNVWIASADIPLWLKFLLLK